jgi:hypothetical protein
MFITHQTLAMGDITWILEHHNIVSDYMTKHFPIRSVRDNISKYTNGFVNIGKLDTVEFRTQDFVNRYITLQIKYIKGLTFIDFWQVVNYINQGSYNPCGWNINHYSYIYKDGKVYREKIEFFLLYDNYDITASKPSFPIYSIEKLSHEMFVEFICPPDWMDTINKYPIIDSSSQVELRDFLALFTKLTEHSTYEIYENPVYIPNLE